MSVGVIHTSESRNISMAVASEFKRDLNLKDLPDSKYELVILARRKISPTNLTRVPPIRGHIYLNLRKQFNYEL